MFSDINISQGSVATPLRCGGICNDIFIANFLLSVTVKEFLKMIILLLKYPPEYTAYFFWATLYILLQTSFVFWQGNFIFQRVLGIHL